MGAGDLLRELDSRVLPPMARGISRFAQGRRRRRLLTGVALISVSAVLVTAVWTVDHAPLADPPGPGPGLVRVGVVEGQSVPGYVRSSRGELAALLRSPAPGASSAPQTYALVTLTAFFAPDRLTAVLGRVAVSEVYARATLTGISTQVVRIPAYRVPDDVIAGMFQAARRRDREQADYRELSAALDGRTDADQRLRRAYDNAARAAAAEATAYRAGCSCVFAAVVRATPADLQHIADRAEVRAVDPAPEVSRLDRTEFSPPLPGQETAAPEPSSPVRPPMPTGTAQPAEPGTDPAPATTEPSPSMPAPVTSASSDAPGPISEPTVETPPERTAVPSALPVSQTATVPS
jgi:hypothetical protein